MGILYCCKTIFKDYYTKYKHFNELLRNYSFTFFIRYIEIKKKITYQIVNIKKRSSHLKKKQKIVSPQDTPYIVRKITKNFLNYF